jgi:cell division protein FtsB
MGVQTEKGAKNIASLSDSLTLFKYNFKNAFEISGESTIITLVDKIFTSLNNLFDYLRDHEGLVQGVFIGMGLVIARYLIPPLYRAAAAMTILNLIPIAIGLAVVALIAIFALLYEDIKVFLEGGDSLIGRFIKKWPELVAAMKPVIDVFKLLWKLIKLIFTFPFEFAKNPAKAVRDLRKEFQQIGEENPQIKQNSIRYVKENKIKEENAKDFFNNRDAQKAKYLSNLTNKNLDSASASPFTSNPLSNYVSQATDAGQISNQISSGLREELSKTTAFFDDGVKS